jgi:hypothetical protein
MIHNAVAVKNALCSKTRGLSEMDAATQAFALSVGSAVDAFCLQRLENSRFFVQAQGLVFIDQSIPSFQDVASALR